MPFWWDICPSIAEMEPRYVVYDYGDDLLTYAHGGRSLKKLELLESRLLEASDLVLASTKASYVRFQSRRGADKVALIRNGVYWPDGSGTEPAQVLNSEGRPVVGMIGRISANIASRLLYDLARKLPEILLVNVGMVWPRDYLRLFRLPNMRFIAGVNPKLLRAYVESFDVCLMPYHAACPGNPMRFYEYASCGKPIVSTKLAEMEDYQDFVRIAETPQQFADLVAEAIRNPENPDMSRALKFYDENSWDVRVERLLESIGRLPARS
jgi:glycosyltransferase involved in cell wall biosynthesis